MKVRLWCATLLICSMLIPATMFSQTPSENQAIDIPYQKFILDNGLTVIVHEDHKAPIVAVNIWYHVGSKNEEPGKSGFAHLFEHLMFNGSEHYDDDYFQVMDRIGATDLNGTTNEDRTNYFENVPSSAVDIALWMESDRMGHLLGAITQEKLDEQRGVVQNEKRQSENQPYGVAYELITQSTWPKAHPYSWTVIGSMDDLDAASLEDVQKWFKSYYGPSNAVLVLAGDIDAETALEKAKQYFGDIPPGPPVARHDRWIARRTEDQRQVVQDRVPAARVYKVWNVPEWGSEELAYLELAAEILGSGKNSRLFKRLLYDDQSASSVNIYLDSREIASQFVIEVTAKPGQDLGEVEHAINEELERFLREGPAENELRRVKTQYRASFIRGIERIGGFGGKSDILAMSQTYGGAPDAYKTYHGYINAASAPDVHQAAKDWLSEGVYTLEVHPFPEYKAAAEGVERIAGKLPEAGPPPEIKFPEIQRTTLSNGLKIALAERHSVPLVNFNLLVNAGYAADQFTLAGTARLAMSMLDEGTKKYSALEMSEALAQLGANLRSGSNLDVSFVNLSTLKDKINPALDLYTEVILHPTFPEKEFQRLQKQQLAKIQQEKAAPVPMALRVMPRFLYGNDHAYGNPLTGSGTEESVRKISIDQLKKFHQTWFKPNNATLVIVGDITLAEAVELLEKRFRKWKAGEVPVKNIGQVALKEKSEVYIMDRPGALQTLILGGHIAPPKANPDEIAIEAMNNILGGQFTARVNMNLREDKHWAYGAFTFFMDARGQRPFMVYAPVQTDKTKESLQELQKELNGIRNENPPTPEELERVVSQMTLELPGSWETSNQVAAAISEIVRFGFPDDYFQTYADQVHALDIDRIRGVARKVIHPDRMVWVVVGDRKQIEPGIRELGLGEIHLIDGDGNLIDTQATLE